MELIYIILGAGIAMLSSVITTIILIRNQHFETREKRNWEIEDRKYDEQKQIFFDRIQQIEDYAKIIIVAIKKIENEITKFKRQKIKEGINLEDFWPLYRDVYILGLIKVYGDDELLRLFEVLIFDAQNKADYFKRINLNNSINVDNMDEPDTSLTLPVIYGKVIHKLDQLRVNRDRNKLPTEEDLKN